MKDKFILGINIGNHDSSAAILKNGELIAIGEQERFSRNKRATGEAPHDAIKFCLESADIGLDDLSHIAFGSDMKLLDEWHQLNDDEKKSYIKLDDLDRIFPKDKFNYSSLPECTSIPHHLAHACSAFSVSGFDQAAILVVDNRGENTSTTLYYGNGNQLNKIKEYGVQHSLGLYYRAAAQYAGICGEHRTVGKLMGLAPYGKAIEQHPISIEEGDFSFKRLGDIGHFRGIEQPPLRTSQLLEFFENNCYPYSAGLTDDIMAYSNFAATIQTSLEDTLLELCKYLKKKTGSSNLVIAGGVGLNCTANGVISKSNIFQNIFIQPMAGDDGVALGAAYAMVNKHLNSDSHRTKMVHPYWGKSYDNDSIKLVLDKYSLNYSYFECDALVDEVANCIVDDKIVGWFQGRAEVGPRALGARSLLGNPKKRETLVRLNNIKGREMWRPLAPSIISEAFDDFFEGPHASPFMIVATTVKHNKRKEIPAAVHIDGSARPQVVLKETNPNYWALINKVGQLNGTPVVVNTSFNVAGEPIVHTPENAINDFLKTDIDVLVIENYVISKSENESLFRM